MTPQEFVSKWKGNALSERSAAQQHFLDLCALFEHPTPAAVDKLGEEFTFERGLTKTGGGGGFADVWKRGFFAFEYKKQRRNLDDALVQLTRYASALENPPLHVVCDTQRFKIVTAWTGLLVVTYELSLDDLLDPEKRKILSNVFHDPEQLRPGRTRAELTRDAAREFATIVERMQHRYPDREAIAHFVNQLVFCFFAEDAGLLPDAYFTKLLKTALATPANAKPMLDSLFMAMESGGFHGIEEIRHFNGGLFDGRRALVLEADELRLLARLGVLHWDLIDPTIFGTLFERFLDPAKRRQIGAHYTPPEKIMQIVEPVIVRPLTREWEEAKAEIVKVLSPAPSSPLPHAGEGGARAPGEGQSRVPRPTARAREAAIAIREKFLDRLRAIRVLDPACGSGNFLYLALNAIKTLELRVLTETEAMGLPPGFALIGPEILRGIEINPVAAELARTTIWIGHVQWKLRNGQPLTELPVLKRLGNIECRDALVTPAISPPPAAAQPPSPASGRGEDEDAVAAPAVSPVTAASALSQSPLSSPLPQAGEGASRSEAGEGKATGSRYVEAEWPDAEFIIGNPPFLGGKRLRKELGDAYVDLLREIFAGRVDAASDLVSYWFDKARRQIEGGATARAGLVATNSLRGGANRTVLEQVAEQVGIFDAWSDEPWMVEGAAVRVSIVCFGSDDDARLNGIMVAKVRPDLTADGFISESVARLTENADACFEGGQPHGPFDIGGGLAREWLRAPLNPNARPNSDVIRPYLNAADVVRRPADRWIVDVSIFNRETDVSYFERPFAHLQREVQPVRVRSPIKAKRDRWWVHHRSRPALRSAVAKLERAIVTPVVAKHRLFTWVTPLVWASNLVDVIARDDDTTFGILHSRFHEAWSLRLGTWLGVGNDPRYTPTTTFETFPFPEGLTPNIPAADYATDPRAIRIAAAAKDLDQKRRAWLNPPDLVDIVPEIVPTAAPGEAPVKYPDRILPKSEEAAEILKTRTLTKLYNERPQWLADLHAELDRAVAAAYGWPEDIATDDALARLLALNLERAAQGR